MSNWLVFVSANNMVCARVNMLAAAGGCGFTVSVTELTVVRGLRFFAEVVVSFNCDKTNTSTQLNQFIYTIHT